MIDFFLGRKQARLVREALSVIRTQQAAIQMLERSLQMYELQHVRSVRDLIEQFLIAQSAGIDVRDELLDGLRDLSDHVARLEEHVS